MNRSKQIIAVAVAAALVLAAVFVFVILPNRDPDAHHQSAGAAKSCGTPISASAMTTYHIVPDQTTVSYTVSENIPGNADHTVIGKTKTVTGQFLAHAGDSPLVGGVDISVKLDTLHTDSVMRDDDVAGTYLHTYNYPNAEFVSTCVNSLPSMYSDGQSITFHLLGNLKIQDKTTAEDFTVQGQISGDMVTGTASTYIFMTDFGIDPPNMLGVTVVQNKVLLTIEFVAQAA